MFLERLLTHSEAEAAKLRGANSNFNVRLTESLTFQAKELVEVTYCCDLP